MTLSSNNNSRRRFAAAAAVSSGAVAVALPAAGAAPRTNPPAPVSSAVELVLDDVTAQQASDVTAAVGRYEDLGVEVDAKDLRVFEVTTREGTLVERLIIGADVDLLDIGAGQLTVEVPQASVSPPAIDSGTVLRAMRDGGPYWKMTGSDCQSVMHYDGVYMDSCYKEYLLLNEPDSSRNYYALEYYGTAGPDPSASPPRSLRQAGLAIESQDSRALWHDWDPRSDTTGGCSNYTIGVSAFGASVSSTHTRCETWDITKPAAATAPFWNMYENFDWPGTLADREVALWEAVTVPQGNTPHAGWYLSRGLDGGQALG